MKDFKKQMENEHRCKTLLGTIEAEVKRPDSDDISNKTKLRSFSEALPQRAAELSENLQSRLHNALEQDAFDRGLETALAESQRMLKDARTKQLTPFSIEDTAAESATL